MKNRKLKANVRTFLLEYLRLCRKHKVFICACGCCSSPWISYAKPDDIWESSDSYLIKHLLREELK